jgi:hypothetical protein
MKRFFVFIVGFIMGAIAAALWLNRLLVRLQTENQRLQVYEDNWMAAERDAAESIAEHDKEKAERIAAMSPQERLKYEIDNAEIQAYLKRELGEDTYNELTQRKP